MNKNNDKPVHIFQSWCKKCGICVAICPKNVLETGPDGFPYAARPEDCILCGLCDIHCPDYAITVQKRENRKQRAEHEETQRSAVTG